MGTKVLLGFEFYGAGNIGDDLMLSGFLDALPRSELELSCCIMPKHDIDSQRRRFPEVQWHPYSEEAKERLIRETDVWIGVGGTPFQASSGPWLINRIMRDLRSVEKQGKPAFLIGVGAERGVRLTQEQKSLLERTVLGVWTRDAETRHLLTEDLGLPAARVREGADLANIALARIFEKREKNGEALGVNFHSESMARRDLLALRRFVLRRVRHQEVRFFANEVRPEYEASTFRRVLGRWRFIPLISRPQFFSPDYASASCGDLVAHYRDYGVLMSSRYHALLTGAWAGVKVCALDRSSSKVSVLAGQLGVPYVGAPFSQERLREGLQRASAVPLSHLSGYAAVAADSISLLVAALRKV